MIPIQYNNLILTPGWWIISILGENPYQITIFEIYTFTDTNADIRGILISVEHYGMDKHFIVFIADFILINRL